jgi:hypothetical protein
VSVMINDEDRAWALQHLMMDCDNPTDRFYIEWDVMAHLYDLLKYGSGNIPVSGHFDYGPALHG